MSIMALLASATVGTFNRAVDMNSAAWNMTGMIDKARAYAMAQNTYVWVGFNQAQASTAGKKNVVVFIVASRDGSMTTTSTNLVEIGKPLRFENLVLADLSAQTIGGYANRPTGSSVQSLATSGTVSPALTLPFNLSKFTANQVLQVDPEGKVEVMVDSTATDLPLVNWIELGLERGVLGSKDKDTAIIQVAGLTGQTRVYRP